MSNKLAEIRARDARADLTSERARGRIGPFGIIEACIGCDRPLPPGYSDGGDLDTCGACKRGAVDPWRQNIEDRRVLLRMVDEG